MLRLHASQPATFSEQVDANLSRNVALSLHRQPAVCDVIITDRRPAIRILWEVNEFTNWFNSVTSEFD